jgi:hypothetical protein
MLFPRASPTAHAALVKQFQTKKTLLNNMLGRTKTPQAPFPTKAEYSNTEGYHKRKHHGSHYPADGDKTKGDVDDSSAVTGAVEVTQLVPLVVTVDSSAVLQAGEVSKSNGKQPAAGNIARTMATRHDKSAYVCQASAL